MTDVHDQTVKGPGEHADLSHPERIRVSLPFRGHQIRIFVRGEIDLFHFPTVLHGVMRLSFFLDNERVSLGREGLLSPPYFAGAIRRGFDANGRIPFRRGNDIGVLREPIDHLQNPRGVRGEIGHLSADVIGEDRGHGSSDLQQLLLGLFRPEEKHEEVSVEIDFEHARQIRCLLQTDEDERLPVDELHRTDQNRRSFRFTIQFALQLGVVLLRDQRSFLSGGTETSVDLLCHWSLD